MSEEKSVMKSKIPLRAKSCIPVRTDAKKRSAVIPQNSVDKEKPASVNQGIPSKNKLKNICQRPGVPTSKSITSKSVQTRNKNLTKPILKGSYRVKTVNKPLKTFSKSSKAVKPSTPIPVVKSKVKIEPTKRKVIESHPAQPDIEFVPDEISRKRILGCIDLPSAPNAVSRGQTSIFNRPSLYQLPSVARPSDPCKALLKTLQTLKGRRETVQSINYRESISLNRPSVNKIGLKPPDNAVFKTLENMKCDDGYLKQLGAQTLFRNKAYSLARKTPKMVLEEAKKRFEEQKLKEESKSVKKVTFQLLNSAPGKENKGILELKPTDVKLGSNIFERLTPDLKLVKQSSKVDRTPTLSPVAKLTSMECQDANLPSSNLVKKPVSILKNKMFPGMEIRRGSLFCSSRPIKTGFGKMRRSISFSNFLPSHSSQSSTVFGTSSQCSGVKPVDNLDLKGQKQSPTCFSSLRRSISSPEMVVSYFPTTKPETEVQARGISPVSSSTFNPLSSRTNNLINELRSSVIASGARSSLFLGNNQRETEVQARGISSVRSSTFNPMPSRTNNLIQELRSSVIASGARSSLFLGNNQREVSQSKKPMLCTPVPVSFYPRSRATDSFSPEFLCPRTSIYISDAPIKTPLVLKNMAEREENDDLSQVRQRLNFMSVAEENTKPKSITHVSKKNALDCMADQECSIILCNALFPYICSPNILNPIAKILENGDEMHFVPVSPCT